MCIRDRSMSEAMKQVIKVIDEVKRKHDVDVYKRQHINKIRMAH